MTCVLLIKSIHNYTTYYIGVMLQWVLVFHSDVNTCDIMIYSM